MARRANPDHHVLRRPSWWAVVVSGVLLAVFLVAIVRELINGHQVRQQVQRLQREVATAGQHQRQLRDLIDYLQSPTFQEREARLQLGLKKNGEQVIVVPPSNDNLNHGSGFETADGQVSGQSTSSHPARWWSYFFSHHSTPSS